MTIRDPAHVALLDAAMRRLGDVYDVAEACVCLSAASGRFITAEVLTVDGGSQAWGEFWSLGKPDYFRLD
jgi:citronellol/citronellal dehydrogenase